MKVKTFKIKVISKEIDSLSKKLDNIDATLLRISKRGINMNASSTGLKQMNIQLAQFARREKTLQTELSKANAKIKAQSSALRANGASASKSALGFNKLGTSLRKLILVGGLATIFNTVKNKIRDAAVETANFNRQARIAGIIATNTNSADDRNSNITTLREEALRLGGVTEYTAAQIAELEVAYGKLGFSAVETLDLIGATADAATVAQEDLGDTAKVVGNAIHAFGFEAKDSGRVVDVMAKSFTSSALNLEKFKIGISRAGVAARAANVSYEETIAMLSVLSDSGFEASMAATSLRNIFLIAQGEGRDYHEMLQEIVDSSTSLATASDYFGRRAAAAAVILGLEAEEVRKLNEEFENVAGFSKTTADLIRDDFRGSLDKLSSSYQNLSIIITTKALPPLRTLVDMSADYVKAITNMITGQRNMTIGAVEASNKIKSFGRTIVILGIALVSLKLKSIISSVRRLGVKMLIAAKRAGVLVRKNNKLKFSLKGLKGAVTGNVIAIAAMVLEFARMVDKSGAVDGAISGFINGFTRLASAMRLDFKKTMKEIMDAPSLSVGLFNMFYKPIKDGISAGVKSADLNKLIHQVTRGDEGAVDKLKETVVGLNKELETQQELLEDMGDLDSTLEIVRAQEMVEKLKDQIYLANQYIPSIGGIESESNSAIEAMYKAWDSELSNLKTLTGKRAEEISEEIVNVLKTHGDLSAGLRKKLKDQIIRIGDFLAKTELDPEGRLKKQIEELFTVRKELDEGDVDGRATIDNKIRRLQDRLEKLKFVAHPVVGVINLLNKEIESLNKQFGEAANIEDMGNLATRIAELEKQKEKLDLIKKRAVASADEALTGVIKEDQTEQYMANAERYLKLKEEINAKVISDDERTYELATIARERKIADLNLDLQRYSEKSIEFAKIKAEIDDLLKEGNKAATTESTRKSLQEIRDAFYSEYNNLGTTKEDLERKNALELQYAVDKAQKLYDIAVENNGDILAAEKELKEAQAKLEEDYTKKVEDEEAKRKKKQKEYFQEASMYLQSAKIVADEIAAEGEARSEKEKQKITSDYQARIDALAGNVAAQTALEKQRDKELEKLDRKEFERQKKNNIAQASIQGAQAILAVLSAAPGFADLETFGVARAVLVAITAAATLAQIRRIKKTEYPGFYEGGATGSKSIYKDKDGRDVAGVVHTNEFVLSEKVLKTKVGQQVMHISENLMAGKIDGNGSIINLASVTPQYVNSGNLSLTDEQLEYFANTAMRAALVGFSEYARESKQLEQMYKNAG